jgi:hypothetical protein
MNADVKQIKTNPVKMESSIFIADGLNKKYVKLKRQSKNFA